MGARLSAIARLELVPALVHQVGRPFVAPLLDQAGSAAAGLAAAGERCAVLRQAAAAAAAVEAGVPDRLAVVVTAAVLAVVVVAAAVTSDDEFGLGLLEAGELLGQGPGDEGEPELPGSG